jgi:hypothetical protein
VSLALLVPAALAASPDPLPPWREIISEAHEDAIAGCAVAMDGRELPLPCAPADATFEAVFVEGRVGRGWVTPTRGLLAALTAGERRVRLAPDRAAADAEVAATLRSIDRLTAPGATFTQVLVVLAGVEPLLDAYAALPGPTGADVASALARPAPSAEAVRRTTLGTCTGPVGDVVEDGFPGIYAPALGGWAVRREGALWDLPLLLDLEGFGGRGVARCEAWAAVGFEGAAPPPPLHFARIPFSEDALMHLMVDATFDDGGLMLIPEGIAAHAAHRAALRD